MIPSYLAHREKLSKPIEILDIRPIQDGIYVMLRDWVSGKDLEVEYFYNESVLHIKHDVKEVKSIQTENEGKDECHESA